MASKKALNAKNLENLGAARLAELLIEISTGNAVGKRRLRLELAGAAGPVEVAREIRKRLTTIGRARSLIDRENRKVFVADLEVQRRTIIDKVAKAEPAEALDLLWRFMVLANPVFERCDDSSGAVIGIFHTASSTSTRQYARPLSEWIAGIGLDSSLFGTHSIRRTKATLIYRRTGNLRAVQLLLGHTKVESTVRYLGVEVDDALTIAEQVDI